MMSGPGAIDCREGEWLASTEGCKEASKRSISPRARMHYSLGSLATHTCPLEILLHQVPDSKARLNGLLEELTGKIGRVGAVGCVELAIRRRLLGAFLTPDVSVGLLLKCLLLLTGERLSLAVLLGFALDLLRVGARVGGSVMDGIAVDLTTGRRNRKLRCGICVSREPVAFTS